MDDVLGNAEYDEGAELMLRVKAGDEAAFRKIIDLYQKSLVNFFYRLGVYHSDIDDLAQLTFLKLYRYRSSYTKSAKFTTYLFLLARQVRVDEVRASARRDRIRKLLKANVEFEESLPEKEAMPLLSDDLQVALSQLSDAHREVVVLGMLKELPYEEVSRIIGIPVGTVKSRMHHALKQLREILER